MTSTCPKKTSTCPTRTRLNVAAGADSSAIDDTLDDAESLLADCDWTQSERQMALQLKDTLDAYNNGIIGPGSCG